MNELTHIFLIDPLSKLCLQKDSTLFMAHTFKRPGARVYLLFAEDLFLCNDNSLQELSVCHFHSKQNSDGLGLVHFCLAEKIKIPLDTSIVIHMRLDPPVDAFYIKVLWLLKFWEDRGVKIINSPRGLLLYNEKILAYTLRDSTLPSLVSSDLQLFRDFVGAMKDQNFKAIILKPLDCFQGRGVEKVEIHLQEDLEASFLRKVEATKGPIVVQPFLAEVLNGEVRALFWRGKELGSILKKPVNGNFLANISQGASYERFDLSRLSERVRIHLDELTAKLMLDGVDLVAFDIMGGLISEVNITCPGLIVEVSSVYQKNLVENIYYSMHLL